MKPDAFLGIELRHLAALEAVATEGSFGRAALKLGYTQSAISQQIATLERLVGERLVERPGGPRPVTLTEAGAILLRHARVDRRAPSGGAGRPRRAVGRARPARCASAPSRASAPGCSPR